MSDSDDGAYDRLLLRLWDAETALTRSGVGPAVPSAEATTYQLRAEIDRLNRRIRNLERSTSWRVTKPLRAFGDLVKFGRRALRAVLRRGTAALRSRQRGRPAAEPRSSAGAMTELERMIAQRIAEVATGGSRR